MEKKRKYRNLFKLGLPNYVSALTTFFNLLDELGVFLNTRYEYLLLCYTYIPKVKIAKTWNLTKKFPSSTFPSFSYYDGNHRSNDRGNDRSNHRGYYVGYYDLTRTVIHFFSKNVSFQMVFYGSQ